MVNIPPISKTSIFQAPLKAGAPQVDERKIRARANRIRNAYGLLGFTTVVLAVYSFYFLYPQTKAFIEAPARLAGLQEEIKQYDEVNLPSLAETRNLKKAAYDEQLSEVERNINTIFPTDVDKLGLVKRLENFATAINSKNPPFEFNAITFGSPVQGETYTLLPISTSIYSSRANFDRFLELINLSGQLTSDIPIRLMEVSNINIRYRGVDPKTGKDKGVDFTVKLNAYSRSET
ncbi:MAG: hypothetical protein V1908_04365 [Candidatus Peregrinibacteria bacterium]